MSRQAYLDLLGKKPHKGAEDQLQRAVVEHLRLRADPTKVVWFSVPNMSLSRSHGGRLKGMGMTPGAPDLVILTSEGTFLLELKVRGGVISDNQVAFAARCDEAGIPYVVCWGIDEALRCLTDWGIIPASQDF